MWAYRLDPAKNHYGMTRSLDAMHEAVRAEHAEIVKKYWDRDSFGGEDTDPVPADTPVLFERSIEIAKNMARTLGWDGTLRAMSCYLVPGPDSFMYGFLITQATGGQRYVVSPVRLTYLEENIDWNCHTSVEEVKKARDALDGEPALPPLTITDWSRSRKGNMYCFINGAQVTVFGARDGGFKGIIASPDGVHKTFTRGFQTELSCANYIPTHFYELVREWGLPGGNTSDSPGENPFAGINWGDDD